MEQDTRRRSSSGRSSSSRSGSSRSGSSRSGSSRSASSRSAAGRSSGSADRRGSSSGRRRKGKRAAARKRRRMIIFAVEAIVLVCLVGVLYFVSKLDKMQSGDLTANASKGEEEDLSGVVVEENPPWMRRRRRSWRNLRPLHSSVWIPEPVFSEREAGQIRSSLPASTMRRRK